MLDRNRSLVLGSLVALFGMTGCQGALEGDESRFEEVDGQLQECLWRGSSFDGDLGIRASWSGSADLDLFVETPNGERLFYGHRIGRSGGQLTKNTCGRGGPSEEVSWNSTAPTGTYRVWVERYDARAVSNLRLEVVREGRTVETFSPELGGARGAKSAPQNIDIAALPLESAFSGELGVQLSWSGSADLDLKVTSPTGETLFFDRRRDSVGGTFTKNECMLSRCAHTSSEEVAWLENAPGGDYRIEIVNYNGAAARDVFVRIHNRRQLLASHPIDVPARRRASIPGPALNFDARPLNPEGLAVVSHEDNSWLTGRTHTLDIGVLDDAITQVALTVNGSDADEAVVSNDMVSFTHHFDQLGQQSIDVTGFTGDGMVAAVERHTLVIADEDGSLPRRGTTARDPSRAQLAARLLELDGVEARDALFDSRYLQDESRGVFADAASNIRDASLGRLVDQSCYGNGPCSETHLDVRMLHALVMIRQHHGMRYNVSTIAGGSHSRNSRHYSGIAVDVNFLNGTKISTGTRTLNREFTGYCRSYGATEVLQPPDAGHTGHIHCAWPR